MNPFAKRARRLRKSEEQVRDNTHIVENRCNKAILEFYDWILEIFFTYGNAYISTICHISFPNSDKDAVVAIVQPSTGIFKTSRKSTNLK